MTSKAKAKMDTRTEPRNRIISICVTPSMEEKLRERAKEDDRSLSQTASRLLERALDEVSIRT